MRLPAFFLGLLCAAGIAAEPLTLTPGLAEQSANHALEALSGNFTIEEAVASMEWRNADTNFGYVDKPLWLRLKVHARESADYVWMTDAFAREIHVYVVRDGQIQMYDLGVAERLEMENRFMRPVLPLRIEAGETDFYFEVRSDTSIQFTSDFLSPDAYRERREMMLALHGGFFGALLLMAFYNLFVYFSTRESSYRSYITYALSAFLYLFSQSGMLLMFVPGVSAALVMRFHLVILGPYIFFMCLFGRSFLAPVLQGTWWDRILFFVMGVGAVIMGAGLIPSIPFSSIARPASVIVLLSLSLVFAAGIAAWRRGYRPARYYAVSLGAFATGAMLLALRQLGIFPHNLLTSHAIQFGTLAEMALLAFALSDRINLLRVDAQARMQEVSRANSELERSEAKYRSIFEDTTDLVFTLDRDGKFLSANNAAYRTIGHEAGDLEGRDIFSLIHASGSMDLEAVLLRDALTLRDATRRFGLQFVGRGGLPVHVSVKLEP